MRTNDIENLEISRKLITTCLSTLRPTNDKSEVYNAQIRFYDYYELASVIRNLMKLCIVALDQDCAEVPTTIKNQSIDVGLILGITLQLFPIDEFELLNEVNKLRLKQSIQKDSDK